MVVESTIHVDNSSLTLKLKTENETAQELENLDKSAMWLLKSIEKSVCLGIWYMYNIESTMPAKNSPCFEVQIGLYMHV